MVFAAREYDNTYVVALSAEQDPQAELGGDTVSLFLLNLQKALI